MEHIPATRKAVHPAAAAGAGGMAAPHTARAARQPAWSRGWADVPPAGLFAPGARLQAKLEVSQPGDPDEVEADRVAAAVLRMPDPAPAPPAVRRCACGGVAGSDGECAACRAQRLGRQTATNLTPPAPFPAREGGAALPLTAREGGAALPLAAREGGAALPLAAREGGAALSTVRRAAAARLPSPRRGGVGGEVSRPAVASAVQTGLGTPGRPLDAAARAFLEPRFGLDFGAVRIHTGAPAAESARAVGALAYTVGQDVVFGAGQYAPETAAGRRLLAHELTHTLQQRDGRRSAARVQRQGTPPAPAPAVRPRGPNPADCLGPLCAALSRPAATCLADPKACAQQWITDALGCLRAGGPASNATNWQDILQNTDQELHDEVAAINTNQPVTNAAGRRQYLDWLASVCRRKQRELSIEFHYNVVFQTVPGQTAWAYQASDWDAVETALAAIPDEHLWDRPGGPRVITFRRESIGPAAGPGQVVGGETDPGTGVVTIYDAGMGPAPYSRSRGLPLPATSQTVRHEVGHLVEGLVPRAEVDRFFRDIVGWREYSWAWVSAFPSPYPNWRAEREELCRDAGRQTAQGGCDDAQLNALLARINAATTVTEGGRVYMKGTSFLTSWPVDRVPGGPAFEYARTSKGDYFAELYALATSAPEFLHDQLPADQVTWLKEQVFHTPDYYRQIIGPFDSRLAAAGSAATEAEVLRLQAQARRQFTRPQLERIAAQIESALQRLLTERPGERAA